MGHDSGRGRFGGDVFPFCLLLPCTQDFIKKNDLSILEEGEGGKGRGKGGGGVWLTDGHDGICAFSKFDFEFLNFEFYSQFLIDLFRL